MKTTIVIIEDNTNSSELLCRYIQNQSDLEIIGTAENGLKGLDLITKKKPDIVVLDMTLPYLSGLEVLERMKVQVNGYFPKVICISSILSEDIIDKAMLLGAKHFIIKPFNINMVVKRIRELCRLRNGNDSLVSSEHFAYDFEQKVTEIFLNIGIPAHLKGYHFLKEAIKIVIQNKESINSITRHLYPEVAKRFDTSPSIVERSIRHVIDIAWGRSNSDRINHAIGFPVFGRYDKPTNGEFIAIIAEKLGSN